MTDHAQNRGRYGSTGSSLVLFFSYGGLIAILPLIGLRMRMGATPLFAIQTATPLSIMEQIIGHHVRISNLKQICSLQLKGH